MFIVIRKIAYFLFPPKVGVAYQGDAYDYVGGSHIEKILFAMTDRYGNKLFLDSVGNGTYRVEIISVQPLHYICKAFVLAKDNKNYKYQWLTRSQPRRIPKEKFRNLVIYKKLTKM